MSRNRLVLVVVVVFLAAVAAMAAAHLWQFALEMHGKG
jgi:hypothetical protein